MYPVASALMIKHHLLPQSGKGKGKVAEQARLAYVHLTLLISFTRLCPNSPASFPRLRTDLS